MLQPSPSDKESPAESPPGSTRLGTTIAVLMGASIPLTAFGKAVLAFSIVPALCIAVFTFGRKEDWRRLASLIRTPIAAFICLVFALWAISAAGSLDVPRSFEVWGRSLLYILAATLLAKRLAKDQALMRTVQISLVGIGGAVLAIILFVIYINDAPLTLLQALGSSKHQADDAFKAYASATACLLPIVLWSGIRLGGVWRALSYLMVPGSLLFFWGSHSRAALLGLLIAILAVIVVRLLLVATRPIRHATVAVLVVSSALGAAVLLSRLPPPPIADQADYRLPAELIDHHRQAIWGFVVAKIKEKPWFGHGIDIINQTEGASVRVPDTGQNYVPSHPHNWVLEIGAETGLLGLAAITLALLALLRRLSAMAGSGRLVGWAGIASFGAFWGSALANFSIWASWWQITFLLTMAIVFTAVAQDSRSAA